MFITSFINICNIANTDRELWWWQVWRVPTWLHYQLDTEISLRDLWKPFL